MSDVTKKVLFFAPYGSWLIHNQVDAVVAKSLQIRGCEVLVVGCNGLYGQDCCTLVYTADKYKEKSCQDCSKAGEQFFSSSFQLPYEQLSNWFTTDDRKLAQQWAETIDPADYAIAKYREVQIGKWVTSSIYTHFRISKKGLSRSDVRQVHQRYLVDGLVTYQAISRLLDHYRADTLFLFNGRFLPYRIAFEAAHQRQIDTIVHERGFLAESFSFFDNKTCMSTQPFLNLVKAWKDASLTKNEIQQVKQYFIDRESGVDTSWPSFYDCTTNYSDVRHKLRIPTDAKILTVFTSSEDELADSEDHREITEQLNIIDRLIEVFKNRPEYLVIRHHPFIGGQQIYQADTAFLSKAYRQAKTAPNNVRIVMPSEALTSYALLWHSDAAIAFFSTVSVEAVARGIPTAVSEASPYSQALKNTIECIDIDALSSLVDRLFNYKVSVEDWKKLYRFTHAYFYKFSRQFRSFGTQDFHFYNIKIKTLEDLQPGIDRMLDRICERILTGSSLYVSPDDDTQLRVLEDEEKWLRQELDAVYDFRQIVQQKTNEQDRNSELAQISVRVILIARQTSEITNIDPWLERSRHKNLVVSHLQLADSATHSETCESILKILDSISEQYVLLSYPDFIYDESVISTSIESLQTPEYREKNAVFWGAWIASDEGEIEREIFTKRIPTTQYQQAIEILPFLSNPLTWLSFAVIRKQSLIQILNLIKCMSTASQAIASLFDVIGTSFYQTGLPLLVVHPNSSSQTNLSDLSLSMLKFSECYQKIKEQPNSAEAYKILGNLLQAQGKSQEAARSYTRAVSLDPSFAEAYANLGNLAYLQNNLDEAIFYYHKAIQINPKLTGVYLNLSKVLHQQGRTQEAQFYQQKSLQLQSSSPE
jgi:tetratricopeptide (TPR) repeat protein